MVQLFESERTHRRCYALCVGIGTYSNLVNRNLRYAVADATIIAERLADAQRGDFAVTVLTKPAETTKAALEEAAKQLLSAPDRRAEDLTLLYFSCHGDINQADHTFCLLPSDASLQNEGLFDPTALISIYDFARWFSTAKTDNIVVLLDVCHSGGAGAALQHFKLNLDAGPNFFFIGAARQDQITMQSSRLQHGLFTHCLLRAFEQPPTLDEWLTISQIHIFVSDEISWFARDQPTQIQSWSVSVNPNLPLLRNPRYPELCPLPPLWNIPFPRNLFFTGQEEILVQLKSLLQSEQKTALTQSHALSGLGGIGKTQLALEYAYRHRQDYHAVLWSRADTPEALISTFVNIAHVLDLPQKDEPDQTLIVEAVKTWLRNRSQWLLILDNADDLALVQDFLPPAFRGHLLLTTRAQTMGKVVGSKLEVKTMRAEMGALLLLRRARMLATGASLEEAPDGEVTKAKELAEELGGLPLALDQAGAYIEETQCGLADYQRQYQAQRAELLARRGGLRDDHPEPVATTWSLSFAKVEQASPTAAELLRASAFLAPDAIPEELLAEALKTPLSSGILEQLRRQKSWFSPRTPENKESFRSTRQTGQLRKIDEAVVILRGFSLVQRNAQAKTLSVHRLVQAVLRDAMREGERDAWTVRMIQVVKEALPTIKFENWELCEQFVPHAEECVQLAPERMGVEKAQMLHWLGAYLLQRQRTREAGRYLQQALTLREQLLGREHLKTAQSLACVAIWWKLQGEDGQAEQLLVRALAIEEQQQGVEHPDTARSLHDLAILYRSQGRYSEAEPLFMRALVIFERQLGIEHPDTVSSLQSLASLYQSQRKYVEAEQLLVRALAIEEQQLGVEHPDTAISLHNLALLYKNQGRYQEAEPLLVRSLRICEQQLGPVHPNTARSLNTLANLYRDQGKDKEAEPLLVRALAINEQQLGPEHPDTAESLHNLANLYESQRKYAEAERLFVRALGIFERRLGVDHLATASGLHGLAGLYKNQGRYGEAEQLLIRALAIIEQRLGPEHPDNTASLNNLAQLYHDQGKDKEAEPLLVHALAIKVQQLGPEHPDTAYSLNSLASLYLDQERYGEAEMFFVRALAIREQRLGPEHPDTAESLHNLALLYQYQKKYEQAELLLVRAVAIFAQRLGEDHLFTASSLYTLASVYQNWGKDEEAKQLLMRALAIQERLLGDNHPEIARSLNTLAVICNKQGKYEQAEPLLVRALAIREQQLGADHPDTVGTLNNLASLYQSQGKYEQAESFYIRAWEVCENVLDRNHPITQAVSANYVSLLRIMRRQKIREVGKRMLSLFFR